MCGYLLYLLLYEKYLSIGTAVYSKKNVSGSVFILMYEKQFLWEMLYV